MLEYMGKKSSSRHGGGKRDDESPTFICYLFGCPAGIVVGGAISFLVVRLTGSHDSGFLSTTWGAALPGAVIGLILAILFPKVFLNIADGLMTSWWGAD